MPETSGSSQREPTPTRGMPTGAAAHSATPPLSPVHVRCNACQRKMNRRGGVYICSGYPLCQTRASWPGVDPHQGFHGNDGLPQTPQPEPLWFSPDETSGIPPPPSSWAVPPMVPPFPTAPPAAWDPMAMPHGAASSSTSIPPVAPQESHWTGLPCSRSRQSSPQLKAAPLGPPPTEGPRGQAKPKAPPLSPAERSAQRQREAEVLEVSLQRKRINEMEVAFHKGKIEGCPKCGKVDKVRRKGSSHLSHNLRCERCDHRIGCVRIA